MYKYIIIAALLIVGSAACSPTAANVAAPPSDESVAAAQAEPEHMEEHEDAHDEDDEAGHEHDEDEHREHGPHEHGAATLTVAWSGPDLEVNLDTPGFNLFGFEHEPSSDEETQRVADAVQALESGTLLVFNSEAACQVTNASVKTEFDHEGEESDAGHEETDHEEEGETHSDVEAMFSLVCASPEAIRSLDLSAVFDRFPNFETLDAQWVSDTNQSSAELTASAPILDFQP